MGIDIVLILICVYAVWKGWNKGLILSVFSILAWLVGLLFALQFSAHMATFVAQTIGIKNLYAPLIAFAGVFVITAVLTYLLGRLLEQVAVWAQLGLLNRLLSILLRAMVYIFVFSSLVWLVNQAGLLSPEYKARSHTAQFLINFAQCGMEYIEKWLPALQRAKDELIEFFDHSTLAS